MTHMRELTVCGHCGVCVAQWMWLVQTILYIDAFTIHVCAASSSLSIERIKVILYGGDETWEHISALWGQVKCQMWVKLLLEMDVVLSFTETFLIKHHQYVVSKGFTGHANYHVGNAYASSTQDLISHAQGLKIPPFHYSCVGGIYSINSHKHTQRHTITLSHYD